LYYNYNVKPWEGMMPNAGDILWFKQNFQGDIERGIAGVAFDVDFLVAIACQETGDVWPILRKKSLPVPRVVALCVGDTLDADRGRRAFPKTKADLLGKPNGDAMFAIAREALVEMAQYVPGFKGSIANPNKFCHGYGVFQYDLQFFLTDPDYFLQKKYERFGESLAKALDELNNAATHIHLDRKSPLTDLEMCAIAIAYNTGGYDPTKGLRQGHFDGTRFYGQQIFDFIRLSRTVAVAGPPQLSPARPGMATIANPTPVEATGQFLQVATQAGSLRVRSTPKVSKPPTANVLGQLPDGHAVRAVGDDRVQKFLKIETSLNGANIRGFASTEFLKPAPDVSEIAVVQPQSEPPASGIVAVYMPHAAGAVTKRTQPADAHSLNESDMPGRQGTTPAELCSELAAIIDYLAVDNPSFKRYRPHDRLTFCNIYAHDYCHLAGVYLPRVWWTPGAIERLAHGQTVEPLINQTIDEQRANDLFRWLRDFGPRFGWRQTGTLTKLQQEANQGAIGIIVARRKEDGRSGHIVAVVPETAQKRARRDASGEVVAPLQSQAGVRNFRYGTGGAGWWKGAQFAESGFWLHA
jgi:hypothetical protein